MKPSINQLCSKRTYSNLEGDAQSSSEVQEKPTFLDKAKDFLKTDIGKNILGKGITLANQTVKGKGGGGAISGSVGSGGNSGGGSGGDKSPNKGSDMNYVYIGLGILAVGIVAYLTFREK